MRVNLLTDAPKHNLALMKISAYHKAMGDTVILNQPLELCDVSYGSWLFNFKGHPPAGIQGGPAHDPQIKLPFEIQGMFPDYNLYPSLQYSLGSTWEYCPRSCAFCCVPKQNNPQVHHSIWEFHDPKFNIINLLNNNTFSDPQWKETFEEIWDAGLAVRDDNGYDARLLDEEKAEALKRTRFVNQIGFAWDRMEDEIAVLRGLNLAVVKGLRGKIFLLMGYDTSFDEDIYRCQKVHDLGFDPWPMLYKRTAALRCFRRFIYARYYRKYPTIEAAWKDYK